MKKLAIFVSALALAQSVAPLAFAQSYSCNGNLNASERATCYNSNLAQRDERMAETYQQRLSEQNAQGQRQLQREQQQWLSERNSCGGNVACNEDAYRRRQGELNRN